MLISYKLLTKLNPSLENVKISKLEEAFNAVGLEIENKTILNEIKGLEFGKITKVETHPTKETINILTVKVKNKNFNIICSAKNVELNKYVIVATPGTKLHAFEITPTKLYGVMSEGMLCSYDEIVPNTLNFFPKEEHDHIISLDEKPELSVAEFLDLDDIVYDLFIPTNRNDLNSYLFLNRELKIYLNNKFEFKLKSSRKLDSENIKINSNKVKSFNLIKLVLNEPYKTTPWYVRKLLIKNEINITNTFADIGNYLTLLTSQPVHFYDASKINIENIIVEELESNKKFIGLDNQTYELKKGDIVTKSDNEIISLSGILGSDNTKVTSESKELILEIANFDHYQIKQTSERLKIVNKAQTIFSKELSSDIANYSINLFKEFLSDFSSNITNLLISKTNDTKYINIDINYINEFLGVEITEKTIKELAKNIESSFSKNKFEIPFNRTDLITKSDVCEEVTKVININTLEPKPIKTELNFDLSMNQEYKQKQKIRNYFLTKNFIEIKTYNLVSEEESLAFNWFKLKNNYKIVNSLSLKREFLRTNLIHSLLSVVEYNNNRKNELNNIFEIQKIQTQKEKFTNLSAIICKDIFNNNLEKSSIKNNFVNAKEIVVGLLNQMTEYSFEFKDVKLKEAYEENSLDIFVSFKHVGTICQLRKNTLKKYDLSDQKIFAFSLNIDLLTNNKLTQPTIKNISSINSTFRNFTLESNSKININKLTNKIKLIEEVIDIQLIDIFKKEDKVFYTFKCEISKLNHSFTKDEILKIEKEINNILTNN